MIKPGPYPEAKSSSLETKNPTLFIKSYQVQPSSPSTPPRSVSLTVKVLVTQSCLTLCDPTDCSQSGSAVHEILQEGVLGWSGLGGVVEYWSGLPVPSPGYLPNPGIKPGSPELQVDSLPSEPPGKHPPSLKETANRDTAAYTF